MNNETSCKIREEIILKLDSLTNSDLNYLLGYINARVIINSPQRIDRKIESGETSSCTGRESHIPADINLKEEQIEPTNEEKLKEQYCKLYGWEKVEGYRIDVGTVDDSWDYLYVSKDQVQEHTFWQYTEEYENVYDTVDEVIEYVEDHMSVPDFETYKNSLSKGKTTQ